MKSFKLPAFYVLLMIIAGLLMGVEALMPLALGFSLFIPAFSYLATKEIGLVRTFLLSVISVGSIVFFGNWKAIFDISAFSLIGILTKLLKGKFKLENLIIVLSLISFGVTVLEDILIGLPEEVKQISWFSQVRWGIYFLSSIVISTISVGIISLIAKEDFGFKKLQFGFWVILLFLLSGFLTILKWFPEFRPIGINIFLGVLGFFVVQGFAIFSYYVERFSFWVKFITFFVIVFFPAIALIASIVAGIFDYWFDFRKLKGGEENGSNST
ncbi:hypothetical protein GFV12_02400 [Desulfurobacterium thermolithotrophum]|uniref:hypothetical protein n=1 Tax=Desulfurobacterium thermolithotrophum TaxID=64160 RepID=UPI0013D43FBA|nr:hypothetical protein [Desulfurobacterium thermolithotrophum]